LATTGGERDKEEGKEEYAFHRWMGCRNIRGE
jgi:hypothetical protein